MNSKLKANYILSFNKSNAGFTLIELLVVIIIIGILSAIALPSYLKQSAKARATEAKNNIGSMNRSQQAYFLENQTFADDTGSSAITKLGIGTDNSTDNFVYTAVPIVNIKTGVANRATSNKDDILSYIGGVFYQPGSTATILCEANTPGAIELPLPSNSTSAGCDSTSRRIF